MTLIEFIAGLLIALVVGLIYYITIILTENAALKNILNDRADRLTNAALENEHLRRKMEKINELTK